MNTLPPLPEPAGPETGAPVQRPAHPVWTQGSYRSEQVQQKSPPLAAFLSLMPGLGQVYVGCYQNGFVNILVVASLITILASGAEHSTLAPLIGLFLAFFWLYNMVDAARRASFYNLDMSRHLVSGEQPKEEIQFSHTPGSLIGGVMLIVFGLLLFAHTRFNFSLAWLEDWWPMTLVILGIFLIFSWRRDQLKRAESPDS